MVGTKPIVMQVQSIDREDGDWVRRVSFPDFPDCVAEADGMEDGINEAYQALLHRLEREPDSAESLRGRPLRPDLGTYLELYRALQQ